MDELDIAGRQYISTRRAGREHGYHSDYIGQLIRGGKVKGQKVGRSWYVDAESLTRYLGKEPVVEIAAAHAQIEESAPMPVPVVVAEPVHEENPTPVVEKVVAVEVVEKIESPVEIVEEKNTEEVQIPIKVALPKEVIEHAPVSIKKEEETPVSPSGLVYVHEDAPTLPQVRTALSDAYTSVPMAKAAVAYAPQQNFSYRAGIALASSVSLAVVVGIGAAAYLSLNVQVEGQTATIFYSVRK